MGNDGGSILGRKDVVKEKSKEKRLENKDLVRQHQSTYCALTKEKLKKPLVGDRLGLVYNKDSLIKSIIEKKLPNKFGHLTSLRDFRDLNITISESGHIQCPITLTSFSGMNSFFFVWSCGCVVSKKALSNINSKDKCIHCGKVLSENDFVSLNYTTEERDSIYNKLIEEKIKAKEKKIKNKEALNMLGNKRVKEEDDKTENENKKPKLDN